MARILAGAALGVAIAAAGLGPALSQGTAPGPSAPAAPAAPAPIPPATPAPEQRPQVNAAPLQPGANSFTEAQARIRLEQAGFQNVRDLKKDEAGVWRGRAVQDGREVNVGLDFRGTIATQ